MKRWQVAVGSLSSWSGWVIGAVLVIRLITALVSDPNRTGNFSPLWLVLWFISVGVMAAVVLLAMVLGLSRALKSKPRPLANLAIIGLAGASGNAVVGYLAIDWGLDTEGLWHIRLAGGFLGHALIFLAVNTLRANLVQRNESIRKLSKIEHELLGFRDSAKQIIDDEVERLKQNTRDTLLPALEKLQELVKNNDKTGLIQDLKVLIFEGVRPLSKQVLNQANDLKSHQAEPPKPRFRNLLTTKVSFKKSIRPLLGLPLAVAFYPMVEFLMIDHRSAFRGLLGALSTVIMLAIIRALMPKRFETKLIPGLLLQLVISAIAMIPAWWIMYQEYGNTQAVLWTAGLLWLINIMSATVLSASLTIQQNQIKYEQTLTQYTEELQKEVALFEQKLSIEKRTWSRIIHGEVQAALTAAVTRLQRTETLEPYQLEMVKQDLARAKDNLINPPKPQANFNQSLSEITSTWRSICTIHTDISARAQRALDQNQDVCIVTNEIIKEAVSNAVRHGQAKTVNIKLDRIKDDILEVEISNDGYKPLRDQTPGLGSQMLDELTLSWQLNTNKNLTTLKATVPISKN